MNWQGILVGGATFLTIGLFHPLVIKAEYRWGKRCWWWFLLAGLAAMAASVAVQRDVPSILLGVVAFSCFWSILEVFEQHKRVQRGWWPMNPKRRSEYE